MKLTGKYTQGDTTSKRKSIHVREVFRTFSVINPIGLEQNSNPVDDKNAEVYFPKPVKSMEISAVDSKEETPLNTKNLSAAIAKACCKVVSLNNGFYAKKPDAAANLS